MGVLACYGLWDLRCTLRRHLTLKTIAPYVPQSWHVVPRWRGAQGRLSLGLQGWNKDHNTQYTLYINLECRAVLIKWVCNYNCRSRTKRPLCIFDLLDKHIIPFIKKIPRKGSSNRNAPHAVRACYPAKSWRFAITNHGVLLLKHWRPVKYVNHSGTYVFTNATSYFFLSVLLAGNITTCSFNKFAIGSQLWRRRCRITRETRVGRR